LGQPFFGDGNMPRCHRSVQTFRQKPAANGVLKLQKKDGLRCSSVAFKCSKFHRRACEAPGTSERKICPVAEAENALNPSLKMTPKEQFIEAANMMCGYSREDLAMLSEKGLIQVIDGFLVLAEEPEKRGNPEICRWAKRLRELRVQLMEGSQ